METCNKKSLNKTQILIISVVAAIVISFVGFFAVLNANTSAVSKDSKEVIFEVVSGDTLNSIIARLEEKEFIKSASFAKLSAKLSGISGFVAGPFKIDLSWDSDTILAYFTKQENVLRDEVMITFREGIWAKDMALLLEQNLGVDDAALIQLWNDETFLKTCIDKYEFLDNSILNSQYRVKLEGYLFPETYSFSKKASLEEITYTFLDHFDGVYKDIKKYVKDSGMSVHELITLASVVQYESKSVEDMKNIAGVFFNRLNVNMPLQSSVTVCYAMYDYDSWEACETNTGIDSPYNTYLYNGLPIGPILNPGSDALNAVFNPAKHEYLYFIADIYNVKKEGAGTVYYSKTLNEHINYQNELGLSW